MEAPDIVVNSLRRGILSVLTRHAYGLPAMHNGYAWPTRSPGRISSLRRTLARTVDGVCGPGGRRYRPTRRHDLDGLPYVAKGSRLVRAMSMTAELGRDRSVLDAIAPGGRQSKQYINGSDLYRLRCKRTRLLILLLPYFGKSAPQFGQKTNALYETTALQLGQSRSLSGGVS